MKIRMPLTGADLSRYLQHHGITIAQLARLLGVSYNGALGLCSTSRIVKHKALAVKYALEVGAESERLTSDQVMTTWPGELHDLQEAIGLTYGYTSGLARGKYRMTHYTSMALRQIFRERGLEVRG